MRIVGGALRGRAIAAPAGRAIRPTADRIREAIFDILGHGIPGFTPEGQRALDLFAGTGALGLEALSRGARYCLFIDTSAAARALIRRSVEALQVIGITRIWRRDVTDLGPCAPLPPFGLVFADPPYGKGLGERALQSLIAGGWLGPGAVIVLEEAEEVPVTPPPGMIAIDRRRYGDTQVVFLRSMD
jgi:16S rRNA (guanine966-N2)-methyltransferase